MEFECLQKLGLEAGFSKVELLDCSTVKVLEQVRDMCASGKCTRYGTNWTCPPACGTLGECEARIGRYRWGLLVQTIGDLEDEYDGEAMMEAQARHKETFAKFLKDLRKEYPDLLALGAGCCTVCASCSYPKAPCRFPEKAVSSVEAYGIMVMDLCKANGLGYYYGPEHIAYTSCYLLE